MSDPRVKVDVRLSSAALAEVDRLAAADERTRSDMLRILLRIGLEEYQRRGRRSSR
jgi:metal-responsive CopG/Arc/MetJ family transcriptional regulator